MNLTRTEVTNWYNSNLSYEEIIEQIVHKNQGQIEVTAKMVKELFVAQGFPTKKRPINKKVVNTWFTIIDDTPTSTLSIVEEEGGVVEEEVEEYA